jgi:PAS domain S-box-containing protein
VTQDSLQPILEIARSAFVTLDDRGVVLEWNACAEEMFGYTREEAVGRTLAGLIVPERYVEGHLSGIARASAADAIGPLRRALAVEAVRRDGSEVPVEVSVSLVREDGRPVFHAWIHDVSERADLLRELEAQQRARQPSFAEILDSLAEAVTIRDAHHHIVYANRAALDRMGFGSLEDIQRQLPQSILEDYLVHDEQGREVTMDAIPSVRLLAGEPADPLVLRTIRRSTGALRWDLLKSSPLHGEDGKPVAAVTVIEDITRERVAELRDQFLARATETLMSSLDYEETLRNVAWLAVPEISDWCVVDLVDERGARRHVGVAHSDPAKLELADRLRRFEPAELDPDRGLGRVMRTGRAQLYHDIADEMLVRAAVDDEHLALLRAVGFRSVLLVPMIARGRILGAMTLVNAESLRRFDEDDREFVEQIASRAAVAVENSRLATARRETARTLQSSLLPDIVPRIDGWSIATLYRAAHPAEEIEVGGDFYDFYPSGDTWMVLLGDVTGKGIEAASLTALVRHGGRFLTKYEQSPSRILLGLNEALREQSRLWLCSALCIRLHSEAAVVASAGHPGPLVVRDDGRVREVGGTGPILGAWSGRAPADRWIPIGPDETLFLYTDGVIDTRGKSERFGATRLRRSLAEHAGRPPGELLGELEAALERFQVGPQVDDTAALALRPVAPVGPVAGAGTPAVPRGRTLPVT